MFGFIITQMSAGGAPRRSASSRSWTRRARWPTSRTRSTLPHVQGDVAFENVTFRYFGGGEPVLKDVSFEAEPGQTVALLGATGSRQDHASST